MYPVSQDFKEMIKKGKDDRLFEAKIKIEHSKGTLDIGDRELVQSALIYTESSQPGEEFTIGGTVASDIKFTILNKPEYENIQFMGATVFVSSGLQIKEGMDAHFIQPSQPSKMPGFEEKWEYVPLGKFNIDDVNKQRNTIELKAIDNMINLDKPYSLSKLSYPATLYQIYVDICNIADVNIGTTNFINKDYIANKRPEGDLSLRDVLGYVAELTGSFARMNRSGALELKWYTPTGLILNPSNRFDFKPSDDLVQIKGIMTTVEDTTYLSGSEDYAIDLTENPLLQGGHETVLPNIFNKVKDTVFTPYESSWQGNMAVQAGDIITQIDRDGKVYKTLVTNSTYKYRGASKLAAKGLPEISKGFKGSTNKKIAEIKRKVEEDVGDQLTSLEQAQLNATELIANMLGGYIVEDKPNGIFYIADNPNIDLAMKIWKYGIDGFGYSSTGKNGPYSTAVTADGSIVAMLVSANIVTANMVQTGILTSADNSSWFNLDNGQMNIKDQLKFVNGQLILDSAEAIKTLPDGTQIKGGTTTIDNTKVRVTHGTNGEYSELNAQGFFKQYLHGVGKYLCDIWIFQGLYSWSSTMNRPGSIRVDLPARFRGRPNVKILLIPIRLSVRISGFNLINEGINFVKITDAAHFLILDSINITNSEAYVMVSAYTESFALTDTDTYRKIYEPISFDILVVGE